MEFHLGAMHEVSQWRGTADGEAGLSAMAVVQVRALRKA